MPHHSMPDDEFLPTAHMSYASLMGQLTRDDILDGLVGWGLFGEKLPPALTSVPFLSYAKELKSKPNRCWHGWVSYRYERNVSRTRTLGIPNPFAYYNLASHIAESWPEIRLILARNTAGQRFRVSRTHVRKLSGTPAIFEMNYDSRIIDDSPIPALLVGKRYRVESDVAQCFPSIYTHAIDWAVLGKDCAKRNTGGSVCAWSHALDKLLQNCKNGETHGLLIGPHASNLVSELILTKVDEMLVEKGYRFVRHIDDYECYAHTHDEAEAFIRDLDFALGEYGLARNQAKTRIVALETCIGTEWVRTLQNWSLGTQRLERKTAAAFLDEAIRLAKANDDLAPLNYAFKMLASHAHEFGMTRPAGTYFANVALHLMYLHPYLIPLAEGIVFGPCMVSITRIQAFAMLIYDQAVRERDHLTACYALYYATKYGFELPTADVELVLQHKDCLLLLFAWMYFGARGNDEAVKTLRKHALDIASALGKAERDLADAKSRGEKGEGLKGLEAKRKTATVEFDRYWLFAYETLPAADLTGEWKAAKRAGVSFIDRKTFEREQNAG